MIDIYEAGSKVSAWRASYFTSNSVEMRWKIQITVRRTLTATLTNCQYERYHVDNNNNHRQQQTSTFPIRRFTMVCTLFRDGSFPVLAIVERTQKFYFHYQKVFFWIVCRPVFGLYFALRSWYLARVRALARAPLAASVPLRWVFGRTPAAIQQDVLRFNKWTFWPLMLTSWN